MMLKNTLENLSFCFAITVFFFRILNLLYGSSCRDGACPVSAQTDSIFSYHFAGLRRGTPRLYNWIKLIQFCSLTDQWAYLGSSVI